MKDVNCIFCKLANGEIPTATIYENEDVRVFLDAGPAAKGHMLVVPKEHYADLMAMPDEQVQKAFTVAKKMAVKMEEKLGCDGINLVQNNHEAAGQTVFHFHIHMIPRMKKDKVGLGWKPGTLKDEVRDELIALLSE